jgi:hypothetical protein
VTAEQDAEATKRVASHEADLIEIYREIYPVLSGADRAGKPAQVVEDLDNLESPVTIEPAKAAAILKSILDSKPDDYFQFECCCNETTADGLRLWDFIYGRLNHIGISAYPDFRPYLRERGWLKPSA